MQIPDCEREGPHDDLVPLQVSWEPVVGLALPLLWAVALAVVVPVLRSTKDFGIWDATIKQNCAVGKSGTFVGNKRRFEENFVLLSRHFIYRLAYEKNISWLGGWGWKQLQSAMLEASPPPKKKAFCYAFTIEERRGGENPLCGLLAVGPKPQTLSSSSSSSKTAAVRYLSCQYSILEREKRGGGKRVEASFLCVFPPAHY